VLSQSPALINHFLLLVSFRTSSYFFLQFIVQVNEKSSVRRLCFKAVWPTAPRDFVLCTTWEEQADGSIIVASQAVSEDICPAQKGFVRGTINVSGFHIIPHTSSRASEYNLQPGECMLWLTAHSNLGGSLPASLINMLATQAPLKMMNAIAAILQR
jgi:hypothetical protein